MAAERGRVGIVHYLVDKGADISVKDNNGVRDVTIMVYGSTPYIGMTPPKKWRPLALKVHKINDTLEMSALDHSAASMSPIRHYRVLPSATGPLTSLESIAKIPDQKVAKMGKSSIF